MAQEPAYTQEQILDALRSMEGFQVIDQEPHSLQITLDLDAFVSEYPRQTPHVRREVEDVAEACCKFLGGIVVTDSFEDHAQRREWRWAMYQQYGPAFSKLYDSNKLRINMLAWVHLALSTAGKGMKVFRVGGEKAKTIQALADQLPSLDKYDEHSVEEKLRIVGQVDDICIAFLAAVAK